MGCYRRSLRLSPARGWFGCKSSNANTTPSTNSSRTQPLQNERFKMQLRTPRLVLELQSPEQVQGMIAALPEEQRAQVSPAWLELVQSTFDADPWVHGFVIQRAADPQPIGFCGFKGPPCHAGRVEIAYGIEATNQGQGFATEAARALVAFAQTCPTATTVLAHTLPEPNASTRVLTKCGFVMTGEAVDPHDGPVWRWELPLR